MQNSQNNPPDPTTPSCRNYDSTQARNKFNEILINFKNNILEIKNKVEIWKPIIKDKNFISWIYSFKTFLSELENTITKHFAYENDYSKLNGLIDNFVTTFLEKELPQNLTNELNYDFQRNVNDDLKQSISLAKNEMIELKNYIEINNVEYYNNINSENPQEINEPCQSIETITQPDNVEINHYSETQQNQPTNQSFVGILMIFRNFLLQVEQDTNTFIPETNQSINFKHIFDQLNAHFNNLNKEKQQFFSNLKTTDHIQFDKWSATIGKLYYSTEQHVNDLKNTLINHYKYYSKEISKSQNANDLEIAAYTQTIEYIRGFMNQISALKQELHSIIVRLTNETPGTNNDKNNLKMKSSEKNNFDVHPRRNTYIYEQEKNHDQLTYNQQIDLQIQNESLKKTVQNLKQLKNVNKDLGEKVQTLEKILNSTNTRIHELENENKSLRKEAAKQIELQTENESLKKKVQNFNQLVNLNNDLREKSQTLGNHLKLSHSQINNLEIENKFLRKEAAKYQSALDDAKNFRISGNDPNNISQLARDIEGLKELLENFCTLKKVNINYTAFKDLLKRYGCSSAGENPSRYLVKGILQRHVIDIVIENANKYLKIDDENRQFLETNENEKEQPLETILISTTKKLIKYIDLFSTNRVGKDEVIKSAPIKLRQIVYAVLENRGFSNEGEHPFIIELRNLIMETLNKYRTIKDPQKIDEINSMATKLIHHIISIFCFRRNIQESIVEYKWFKNTDKVDLEFMDCSVDEDEHDKIMVDICYFPLIGINLEHDEKYQVITRASVVQTDTPVIYNTVDSMFK
ncbi:hypothetical protein F8M41_016336 [Gigaspora margarita]|uniref:Uncharacterized protein n=1 Tax=Gigaspora margarita TaxID=4874 RepID=A0A8H4EMZ0_GIGMA|nr:hypothetical protein F8M41_016336 [Gigaspora margarita]